MVIMSIITKPFKHATFRITLFSIVGAAIGLLALGWYAHKPVGGVLPPGAMSDTVNYPEIDGQSDFRPMVALPYVMRAITEFPIVTERRMIRSTNPSWCWRSRSANSHAPIQSTC